MENNNWAEEIANALISEETKNVRLGIKIAKIKQEYYYADLIKFLKGDDSDHGSMYFANLKPLFDEHGYEKIKRILLELDKEDKGDGENE